MKTIHSRMAIALAACGVLLAPEVQAQLQKPPASNTVVVKAPKDPWQVRREATWGLINILRDSKSSKADSEAAWKKFDAILTAFDKDNLSITPMEGVDLFQNYYVPNDKDRETQLLVIAALTTLGWYDALRFADESGREEIINNEAFFKRALLPRQDEFLKLLESEPKKAAAAVAKGISVARDYVNTNTGIHYDTHWPASYGLKRMQCGLQQLKVCEVPPALPKSQWPAAFEEAAAKVTHYYRINKDSDAKSSGQPEVQVTVSGGGAPAKPTAATPKTAIATAKVFGQVLAYTYPLQFKPAFEDTKGDTYIQESVLAGETVDKWTQMFTLSGAKGLSANPNATPEKMLLSIVGGFQKSCPDTFAGSSFGSTNIDGHTANGAWASCGISEPTGKPYSESAVIVVIKGDTDYYTLQWAERGPASKKPMTLDKDKWMERINSFLATKLCPIVPGEKPPYPSCTNRGAK